MGSFAFGQKVSGVASQQNFASSKSAKRIIRHNQRTFSDNPLNVQVPSPAVGARQYTDKGVVQVQPVTTTVVQGNSTAAATVSAAPISAASSPITSVNQSSVNSVAEAQGWGASKPAAYVWGVPVCTPGGCFVNYLSNVAAGYEYPQESCGAGNLGESALFGDLVISCVKEYDEKVIGAAYVKNGKEIPSRRLQAIAKEMYAWKQIREINPGVCFYNPPGEVTEYDSQGNITYQQPLCTKNIVGQITTDKYRCFEWKCSRVIPDPNDARLTIAVPSSNSSDARGSASVDNSSGSGNAPAAASSGGNAQAANSNTAAPVAGAAVRCPAGNIDVLSEPNVIGQTRRCSFSWAEGTPGQPSSAYSEGGNGKITANCDSDGVWRDVKHTCAKLPVIEDIRP